MPIASQLFHYLIVKQLVTLINVFSYMYDKIAMQIKDQQFHLNKLIKIILLG